MIFNEQEYEKFRLSQLIPNPWNVPKIQKIGLIHMYIIDAVVERLGISAELNPESDDLIDINPVFVSIVNACNNLVDNPSDNAFESLVRVCPNVSLELIRIYNESDYIPDPRVVETIEECLASIRAIIVNKIYPQ